MKMNRVVITGMGWVTPMGHDIESVWKHLLNGESGIDYTTIFDASTFPTTFSAEVKGYDLRTHIDDVAGKHKAAGRNSRFALGACAQAWRAAGMDKAQLDLDRVGIYLGSGEGSLDQSAGASMLPASSSSNCHASAAGSSVAGVCTVTVQRVFGCSCTGPSGRNTLPSKMALSL